jgi:hypothetical protein
MKTGNEKWREIEGAVRKLVEFVPVLYRALSGGSVCPSVMSCQSQNLRPTGASTVDYSLQVLVFGIHSLDHCQKSFWLPPIR